MTKSTLQYYFAFAKRVNYYFWSDKAMIKRKWYVRYGFSVLLLFLATSLKILFYDTIGTDVPFLAYFAIVILATGFGGIGPGIFTTIISALISDYYFLEPHLTLSLDRKQGVQLILFVSECLLLISLSGAVTRASRNLRRRGERFRAMLENSKDAIIVVNAKDEIVYASPATERVIGYTPKELKRMKAWERLHADEQQMLFEMYLDLAETPGMSKTVLHKYLHKNNSWSWIENTFTNLKYNPGVNGIVFNFRNVTDKVLLERQKDDFVGVATHELKTPVTSIKAYAQILLKRFRREGNDPAAAMIEKMDQQLNKLITLISDMLDVTKIEGGRLYFQEGFYDFNEMVTEVVEELQRTTNEHIIELKLDESEKIFGDRERVGQVLTNLITNAIKYSPSARNIYVSTALKKSGVMLCVEDHGVGIAKENQGKIFERFFRVSGPEYQTFPGIGLGLYISYEIVKKQGGRIWVQSEKGKGSTFCFELPYNYKSNMKSDRTEMKITDTP
ncbi:MAG: ATP-binding protein [Ginsengibacter sp.]